MTKQRKKNPNLSIKEMSFSVFEFHTAVTTRLEWHDLAGTGFCRLPLDHHEY